MSLATILCNRRLLGWIYHGSAYCQLIRSVNKEKRVEWVRNHLDDTFDDVIWTDETSVQLETHRRFCYRKEGMKPRPKPRAKHPIKVHVWAGISKKGPANVCIFEGKWMHHYFARFFKEHSYLLFKRIFQLPVLTDLCKTMIRNIVLAMLNVFMKRMGSIGDVHRQNLQI